MHLSMLASLISAFDFFDYANWAICPVVYDMSVASSSPVEGRGRDSISAHFEKRCKLSGRFNSFVFYNYFSQIFKFKDETMRQACPA